MLTKVFIVKAMVFPVVMYGCESWTIKKAEYWRYFPSVVLEKTLESPLDSKEIKSVNPEGNQPWIFIGRTNAEGPIVWPLMWRADLLEKTLMLGKIEGRRRRGWQRMRCLDAITDSMAMRLSKLQEIVKDKEVWHAAVHGVTGSDMTDWLNNKRTLTRYLTFSGHWNPICWPKDLKSYWRTFLRSSWIFHFIWGSQEYCQHSFWWKNNQ